MRENLNTEARSLDSLVKSFYENKTELDSYKKICDEENSQIKAKMAEMEQDVYEVDGLTAKLTYKDKSSFNEVKLLAVAKELGLDVIRTREYVDMDLLEKLLYSDDLSKDAKAKLNACVEPKTEVSLRVTRKKEK